MIVFIGLDVPFGLSHSNWLIIIAAIPNDLMGDRVPEADSQLITADRMTR